MSYISFPWDPTHEPLKGAIHVLGCQELIFSKHSCHQFHPRLVRNILTHYLGNAAILWPHIPRDQLIITMTVNAQYNFQAWLVTMTPDGTTQVLEDCKEENQYQTPDIAIMGLLIKCGWRLERHNQTTMTPAPPSTSAGPSSGMED
jgi:hypothetical protein